VNARAGIDFGRGLDPLQLECFAKRNGDFVRLANAAVGSAPNSFFAQGLERVEASGAVYGKRRRQK
jgi:hypothetical protein